jgi:hypothetical protein
MAVHEGQAREAAAMQTGERESAFIHSFPDPNITETFSTLYAQSDRQ